MTLEKCSLHPDLAQTRKIRISTFIFCNNSSIAVLLYDWFQISVTLHRRRKQLEGEGARVK